MNLKNKDIMERMRVTNGKDKLKVISWDKSYTDCLLNYLDSKGNRYVVAQSYELSGTEKDPQISWANGRYFTANSDDEALEEYLDYLGEVNEYDISESLKESKEFFVGSKTWQGYEVCMIEDGKKYYLSKLAKNIEDSSWSSDHTYAKHWKDESRAEEVVDMLNSELKESKKSIKKSLKEYNKKDGRKYKIYGYSGKKETFVIYTYKRNDVFNYTMTKDYVLENFPNEECDSTDIDNLNYFVKYEGLGELIYGYMAKFNGEDYVDSIECVRNKGNILEVTINLKKEGTFLLKNGWWDEREATKFFGYYTCDGSFDSSWVIDNDGTPKIYLKLYIYSPNNRLLESLKESAKSINEKNVAKFVDELNKFCDEKIHYVDGDAERFTKKYGKMYNFKYRFDDTDEIFVVYDSEGTLDMFDDNADYVREEIDRLAKKNGWYADPYTSSANFTFGEI